MESIPGLRIIQRRSVSHEVLFVPWLYVLPHSVGKGIKIFLPIFGKNKDFEEYCLEDCNRKEKRDFLQDLC